MPFHGSSRSHTPHPSVFKVVQACRLPALKPSKPSRRPFHGNSRSYTLQTNSCSHTPQPSVFKSVQACRLPALKTFQTLQTLPQAFPRQLSQLHAPNPPAGLSTATLAATRPSHLFLRRSSLQFARPQTLQTLPRAFPRQLSQPHAPAICF